MNLATRAALYNALLFPGWGHIYLKKYKRGIALIISVLAGILYICWSVAQVALNILKIHPLRKGTVDLAAIVRVSTDSIKAINSNYVSLILLLMIFIWIISIIDAYQLGKKKMHEITIAEDQKSVFPED